MINDRPLLPILRDDPALNLHIRKSVQTLADYTTDPGLRKALIETLAGQGSLRDIVDSPEFIQAFTPAITAAVAEAEQLTDEEREALAEDGRRAIDAEYEASQQADQFVAEDDEYDDDDDGFNNRGPILRTEW